MLASAGKIIVSPTVIPRSEHSISRGNIGEYALKVLYRLKGAGFQAYLVGGGVRDLLLGREPKDFDVVTDAHPEQVRGLFRNCRLIGRRFRLAHVHFGRDIVEVATFRALHDPETDAESRAENGRILSDNVYGSIEEDAWRRDFSVNALYYNIEDFSVVDYVGGVPDLRNGLLRLVGDNPVERYREDPVRMLRAVRFAGKLGFRIQADSEAPIFELGGLLEDIPPSRLFEEVLKLFMSGYAVQCFELLRHYRLFEHLFPQTEASLAHEQEGFPLTMLSRALENTDARVAEGKPVTPAFLFAALLWEPVRLALEERQGAGATPLDALQEASDGVLARQLRSILIPKRFTLPMREIWSMQPRFEQRTGKRPARLLGHPRFRAGYDFLVLRAAAGEAPAELAQWWTQYQEAGDMPPPTARAPATRPRRRRRRRAPPVASQ